MEIHNLQLYNADNLEIMANLPDESIDVVCIDPPYLYLKNKSWNALLTRKGFLQNASGYLPKKALS